MNPEGRIWKRVLGQTIVVGGVALVAAFAGARMAIARNGVVGNARSFVTVAGTLTGVTGSSATITFEFQRREGATTTTLCAPAVTAQLGAEGAFSVPVPLDDATSPCPSDAFDGRDVWVRALVGGSEVAAWAPVNPVPYAHFASVAGVARQYETPECPSGYARDSTVTRWIVCQRRRTSGTVFDEVVRVGTGNAAFWIDRYESTVHSEREGSVTTLFRVDADFNPTAFPRNGQWRRSATDVPSAFALSVAGAAPARFITWFQAHEACVASGKRLALGTEWLLAAAGTPDPGDDPGTEASGNCRTAAGASGPRDTGRGTSCISGWGAQDMIGNVAEWTADWYSSVGQITSGAQTVPGARVAGIRINQEIQPWPSLYGSDFTSNVSATTFSQNVAPSDENVIGLPAAIVRGGAWGNGVGAGVFSVNAVFAPSHWNAGIGFRCVIPR